MPNSSPQQNHMDAFLPLDNACPFTTLYWDFLSRHEGKLNGNNRMSMQLSNLRRKPATELREIRRHASKLRKTLHASVENRPAG